MTAEQSCSKSSLKIQIYINYNAHEIEIAEIPYMFLNLKNNNRSYSALDQFLVSPTLKCLVSECRSEYLAVNYYEYFTQIGNMYSVIQNICKRI